MSRPEIYNEIAQSGGRNNKYLAGSSVLYALVYQGEFLLQIQPLQHEGQPLRKYYRHIYSTQGQARARAVKIKNTYGIDPDIVELNINDLSID